MEKDNIFERVREGLKWRLDSVVPALLPGGRFRGREYICASIEGGAGNSCATNLETGVGGDFSTEARWGDVIALAARVWKIRPVEAARRLAEQYGLLTARRPAPTDWKMQAPPGNKGEGNVIPIIFFGPEPPERHPRRLYTVIAGASAKARKGTSAKPVLRIFKDNPYKGRDAVPPAPHTGGPLSSGEGLAWRLRERDENTNEEGESKPAPRQDKRQFVLDEEFAAAIACAKREGNILSMTLRSLWDSGDYEPLTKNSQISVRGAHVGIVTHITIPEVQRKLDAMQISNGFANRFLWICARRIKLVPYPEAMPHAEFQVLCNELWRRIRLAQGRRELCLTPEAREYWANVYSDLSRDLPGAGGDIVARGEAQCIRLALIYALLDGSVGREDAIDTSHLKAALALWQYARDSALYIFGNMEEEETSRKIYTVLRESPKSTTELYALFSRHIQNSKLQACLQELVGRGLVEKREIRTAGRPRIVYCAAEKENQEQKQ